jgi:hypothetical protein
VNLKNVTTPPTFGLFDPEANHKVVNSQHARPETHACRVTHHNFDVRALPVHLAEQHEKPEISNPLTTFFLSVNIQSSGNHVTGPWTPFRGCPNTKGWNASCQRYFTTTERTSTPRAMSQRNDPLLPLRFRTWWGRKCCACAQTVISHTQGAPRTLRAKTFHGHFLRCSHGSRCSHPRFVRILV